MEGIYILHFTNPITEHYKYGDANHYVGKSLNLKKRLMQHDRGKGSAKTKFAVANSIPFTATVLVMDPTTLNEGIVTRNVLEYCLSCEFSYGESFERLEHNFLPNQRKLLESRATSW